MKHWNWTAFAWVMILGLLAVLGNKHAETLAQQGTLMIAFVVPTAFIFAYLGKSDAPICRKHLWSNDMSRPKIWREQSGWQSMGGFPEREDRKCIRCGKCEIRHEK